MKKKLNVVELITQIAYFLILMVAPLASYKVPDHAGTNSLTGNTMLIAGSTGTITFADLFATAPLFYLIFIALIVCNIILCIVSIKNDSAEPDSKLHIALPIINFIIFVFVRGFMLLSAIPSDFGGDIASAPVYTLLIAISFVIIILAFVKRAKAEPIAQATVSSKQPISVTAELEKYNDLLEKGIITQNEFNTKKKQLLGL